jgi:hypothetical protein
MFDDMLGRSAYADSIPPGPVERVGFDPEAEHDWDYPNFGAARLKR